MSKKLLTFNLKSFLAFILAFALISSIIMPTVMAAVPDEKVYEEQNEIKGGVIDFSDREKYDFSKHKSYAVAILNENNESYSISKNGSNYTIILNNVTAKKIILPYDDADLRYLSEQTDLTEKADPIVKKDLPRETHITIELNGTNKIDGYGLTGYYIKGLTLKGSGSLEVTTHLENISDTDYIVPGIFIETDEIKDLGNNNENIGFVFDGVDVTVTNPYYWGIICNGDIILKNESKLTVKPYPGIDKRAEAGDISTDKLFIEEGSELSTSGEVKIFKEVEQRRIEAEQELREYIEKDKEDPIIKAVIDETEITSDNGKTYCKNPIITVTDDTKIVSITINGETIREFTENTDTEKIFEIPLNVDCKKTIVATDVTGKKTEFKISSNSGHTIYAKELNRKEATCVEQGFHEVKYICAICKEEFGTETVTDSALGHKFGNWVISGNKKQRTCSVCKTKESQTIENVQENKEKPTTPSEPLTSNPPTTQDTTPKEIYSAPEEKITVKDNTIKASNITKNYSTSNRSFSINAKQTGNGKLTYSSNNKSSVTVSSSGKVTVKSKFIGKATITIKASATSQYKAATKKITVTVNPPTVKVSKLSNSKGKKMTVKWSKNNAVTGYQIQYSTDKKFKKNVKTVTITKKSITSKTVSKLSKNKKYYVRIRSYKTVSKVKYYSSWSAIKNLKIKK